MEEDDILTEVGELTPVGFGYILFPTHLGSLHLFSPKEKATSLSCLAESVFLKNNFFESKDPQSDCVHYSEINIHCRESCSYTLPYLSGRWHCVDLQCIT
ncbi:hypothetical protein NPIL_250011 [Nephila pilipes]|uniref:Uncharacterized protein n=1 Tax=Nephila pilipes TaxID=299642 RepID=A0A8X6JUB6_NEPPI|nr:hypothetical protein NPIL_250011 [Nephila pilipes]